MYRTFGEWGGYPVYSYGVLNLASAFLCIAALALLLRLRGQNLAPAIDLTLLMILGYTVLARLFHVLLEGDWEFFTRFSAEKFEDGYWGGQIGFGLIAAGYLLITRAPFAPLADALAVTWAFISVPHKVACFLGGCCGGSPTAVPWGVTFPEESARQFVGMSVHPTQLYDAAGALVLGALLLSAYLRRRGEGRLFLAWGLGYALLKFATEWFRGDGRFTVAGPVSAAMIAEIVAAVFFAVLILKPGPWTRLLAWHERRTSGRVEPAPVAGRAATFFKSLGGLLLAAAIGALATLVVDGPGAAAVVFVGLCVMKNVLDRRRVTRWNTGASAIRRFWRGLVSAMTPLTFFGLFRPLFDLHARTLADAAAGTYSTK